MKRIFGIVLMVMTLGGCVDLRYYGQAVSGQWQLLSLRRPVKEVLADSATPETLRRRLELARRLRSFASTELALPDNGSYRSYADLHRPFVVWNVFAAPALSLELRRWCFPVLGCVSYRGYFRAAAAQRFAGKLQHRGDDVYVAGIPAYSTLGWFDDPLLNTFVYWPTGRLAELIFHELAHQRLFIAGDTAFNESFATAVGQLGTRLWLAREGTHEERDAYEEYLRRQHDVMGVVAAARGELGRLYASSRSHAAKLDGKRRLLKDLQRCYQDLKRSWGGYALYDRWFNEDLNNAKLAALNTYTRYVPAFEALYEETGRNFEAFYRTVGAIGELPARTRSERLQALMAAQGPIHAGPAGDNAGNGHAGSCRRSAGA